MNWLKKNFLALIVILAVIALSVVLYLFRDTLTTRLNEYTNRGDIFVYIGAFFISLIGSLTIVLPFPGFLILIPFASVYNPIFIALAASTGGIIGELSGYAAGRSGRSMLRANKAYLKAESWMKRRGVWAIMLFAFIPLVPFDVAGLAAGALRMPLWKFMIAGWIGKSAKFILLLMLSYWGFRFIPHLFGL
ncbi:MAG: VTT domain-containing protein [Dehalococcoidales bacterium]|nr:VTT domain-containing protein [Dehalococcoidales bacterium]